MFSKIYLSGLAVAFVAMSFLTLYAYSWLGSIGNPADALAGYEFYAGLSSTLLWVSTAFLLIAANIILWNSRRGWAMWTSFAYFSFFVIAHYFWLERALHNFKNSDGFFSQPLLGVFLILIFGAIVFFNQYLNLRLNGKMYPPKEDELDPVMNGETEANEKDA